jgi:hypothetical protein
MKNETKQLYNTVQFITLLVQHNLVPGCSRKSGGVLAVAGSGISKANVSYAISELGSLWSG